MTQPYQIRRIFHPTDFTKSSETAFVHALKFALLAQSSLHILHVDPPNKERAYDRFPKVRQTLAQWGLLPEDAFKDDLAKLKLRIRKSIATGQDPCKAMLGYLEKKVPDLMVLSTQQRDGLARLFKPSLAGSLARNTGSLSLFMPAGSPGFIDKNSGQVRLRRILVPVDFDPPCPVTIDMAIHICNLLQCEQIDATLLHVTGKGGPMNFEYPEEPGWNWEMVHGAGKPVEGIIHHSLDRKVDLIVMGTLGRNGLFDALLGSTTERVVREAPCPVLSFNGADE